MKKVFFIVAALCLAICTGSCTKSTNKAPKAILQLKWIFNAGFAGDLVALEKGFWRDEGIDVEIRPGGVGITPIKVVAVGDAQFGVATGDQLLLAADEQAPVLAIALAYQKNPLVWIVREDSGIKSAADFKGKKIGLTFIDDEPLFRAMMERVGLDPQKDVFVVPVKFDISPFTRGEIDAYPAYRNTQAIEIADQLKKEGIETRVIGPADEDIVSYSNLYFVRPELEESNPLLVGAFVRGVMRGWEYAIQNPQEAAAIVAKYDKETPVDVIVQQVVATAALVQSSPEVKLGIMTVEGWQETLRVLQSVGQIKQDLNVQKVFTLTHLE